MKTIVVLIKVSVIFLMICVAGVLSEVVKKYIFDKMFDDVTSLFFEVLLMGVLIILLVLIVKRINEYKPKRPLPRMPEPLEKDPYEDDKKNHHLGADIGGTTI